MAFVLSDHHFLYVILHIYKFDDINLLRMASWLYQLSLYICVGAIDHDILRRKINRLVE